MNYLELERTLARHIHLCQQAELHRAALTGELRLSMSATPAYRLGEHQGEVSCDLFTCHIFRENGKPVCQLEMCRVEAKAPDKAELIDLRWYPIQQMKAWPYPEGEDPFLSLGRYPLLPAKESGDEGALIAIRNLQNLFFEHRLHRLEELFSSSEEAELEIEALGIRDKLPEALKQCQQILDSEAANAHCYRFLGVTGLPVIELSGDGIHAKGLFMTQLYQVEAAAFRKDPKDWTLHRTLAVTCSEYVREADGWKILRMQIRNLVSLPTVPYSVTGRYDRCGQSDLPWTVAQCYGPAPDPDTCLQIEQIIHGWAYGCRLGSLPAFVAEYMQNPLEKNRLWIKSFGNATPVMDSLEKINAKIEDMTNQYREGYYTFHAPTTPVIRVLPSSPTEV